MNLLQILTWLIPAFFGGAFLSLVLWNAKEPLYLRPTARRILMGLIVGYFTNEVFIIYEWQKYIPPFAGLFAFLAQWIGELILKNKWIILKAKTGLDGSDEKDKT